jgi:tRNA (adenine37-N6)-methyltransferase
VAHRAPKQAGKDGLSHVRLLDIEGDTLVVADVDMLDQTPLLDIKPYVPRFDVDQTAGNGWLPDDLQGDERADRRFDR